MAAVTAPVELPAGRRSFYAPPPPVPDMLDPKWIPVLEHAELKVTVPDAEKELSPYHVDTSSPVEKRPKSVEGKPETVETVETTSESPKPRPLLLHNDSRISLVSRYEISELDAGPVPHRLSTIAKQEDDNRAVATPTPDTLDPRPISMTAFSSDGQETLTSESVAASTAPSTIGAGSAAEDGYYGKEDLKQRPFTPSARSSVASSRKMSGVLPPTSKYNRKTVNSTASMRPPTIRSQPQTPQDSPRLAPLSSPLNLSSPNLQRFTPTPTRELSEEPAELNEASIPVTSLQPKASTASERRQRALHSHPSNVDLHTHAEVDPSSEDTDEAPRPPSSRHKPAKLNIVQPATPATITQDTLTPTPAITTKLPQSLQEAQQPTVNDENAVDNAPQPPPPAPSMPATASFKAGDHSEMASFMTKTNTLIFRRFDDVHVRLLLCLQDEISALEHELQELEGSGTISGDKNRQRTQVLRELRRVVAEYDHLFANWSQMQANKASQSTIRDLQQWLKNPKTSAGAGLAGGAQEDLAWLENSKDLSSVVLNPPSTDASTRVANEKVDSRSNSSTGKGKNGQGKGEGKGGGFLALFNCMGK